jgi:D-3-phosphoglycerate dehydrogenase
MCADDPSVLLLEAIHPDAATLLSKQGHITETVDRALDEDELITRLPGVGVLGIRSGTKVTAAVLDAAPDLLAVGAFCVGTNQIDLAAATDRGVTVFNAPFSNTRSVVELVLAEVIALTRRLTEKNALMHRGEWNKSAAGAHEVRGRRLGIVGYGNIGSQLSVLAENLGMSVFFYDLADKLALGNAQRCASLEELLSVADIVSLHVDGRPGNEGLIGADELARMPPGGLLLNLSRGCVVDHRALRAAIESGRLAGAAVDVFPHEPGSAGERFISELRGLPNVILTPHVGGSTEEAQQHIAHFVSGKLHDFVASGDTTLSVNVPGVALADQPGARRLTLLHRNTPGVLGSVNSILAGHGANIQGQMLSTRGDVGYAVTDLAGGDDRAALRELRDLPATIRPRLIRGVPHLPDGRRGNDRK